MIDERRGATSGDRPGTCTAAEEYKRAAHEDEHAHGKLADDPKGVFKAHHESSREGERDFSEDPKKACQVSRKMGKRDSGLGGRDY